MPAVTPAEVHTLPSRMKIGSGSTVTSGNSCARRAHVAQWVVALRPSSSPARASKKAPEHTEVTRRDRCAADRIQATSRSSTIAWATPRPPTTTRVSIGPRQAPIARLAPISSPFDARITPPSGLTTSVAYSLTSLSLNRSAIANTSSGPARSSSWRSGKTTSTTRRAIHPRVDHHSHGRNDKTLTISATCPSRTNAAKANRPGRVRRLLIRFEDSAPKILKNSL